MPNQDRPISKISLTEYIDHVLGSSEASESLTTVRVDNDFLTENLFFATIESACKDGILTGGVLVSISIDQLVNARSVLRPDDFKSLEKEYRNRILERFVSPWIIGNGSAETIIFTPTSVSDDLYSLCAHTLKDLAKPYHLPSGLNYSLSHNLLIYPVGLLENGKESMADLFYRFFDATLALRDAQVQLHPFIVEKDQIHKIDLKRKYQIALRTAFASWEFSLVYQPIFNSETGYLSGAEALIRWQSLTLGSVPPSSFIELAESSGLIHDMTYRILRQAAKDTAVMDLPRGARVSVNISPLTIGSDYAMQELLVVLKELQGAPLSLEVTESILLYRKKQASFYLQQIRQLGFKVLLDDFGTGFSNLQIINQLPFDTLKVDRSFISRIHERSAAEKMVLDSIINIAQAAKLDVVVEGIETPLEDKYLKQRYRLYNVQGFYYATPMTISAWQGRSVRQCQHHT